MAVLRLEKNPKWIFNGVVNSVNFYYVGGTNAGQLAGEAGYLGKSAVSINAAPKTLELIDGNKLQQGYELSVEITSEQYYSVFEFNKLVNQLCYISLPDVPLWVMPLMLNVEMAFTPGEQKGQIKITGSKFAPSLLNLVAPSWNGQIVDPYPYTKPNPTEVIIPQTSFEYVYVLEPLSPDVIYIIPAEPVENSNITELKLIMKSLGGGDLTTPPNSTILTRFNGMTWVTLSGAQVVYEGGRYLLHFDDDAHPLALKDRLKVVYNYAE